jgi:hypothetical protein
MDVLSRVRLRIVSISVTDVVCVDLEGLSFPIGLNLAAFCLLLFGRLLGFSRRSCLLPSW